MNLKLPKEAEKVIFKLENAGFEAYAVGGCVRDLIMKRDTGNWDFTTSAQPFEIQQLFPDSFYDNTFGTVKTPVDQKTKNKKQKTEIYEITTYRSEFGYSDHRHPDKIKWGEKLEEDLKRRDFTINAIAFNGKKLVDLFDGQKDLVKKIIRAVGEPDKRFSEDALRMMRAVRIANEIQFTIEINTFEAIKKNIFLLKRISSERIRDELIKILTTDYPADGIKLLRNSGLLSLILPELEKCFGIEQKSAKRHHIYDVGTHLIKSLEYCPSKDPLVRLATLLHDVGKEQTFKKTSEGVITFYNHEIIGASIVRNIAKRLRFSKKDSIYVTKLVRWHQFTVDERQTDSAIRRFIRNVGKDNLKDILDLRIGDRLGGGAQETSWRLELFKKRLIEVQKQPFTVQDLKVNGHDVMKIYDTGPGTLVGKVLDMIFKDVVEAKIPNEREMLLKRLRDLKKIVKPSN